MEEQKNFKIFLSGVPNSGKTTFLYKLKLKEIISTLPTIGYNVETVKFLGKNYEFWDVNNKHLPKYLEEEKTQTQTAGIIHLIRDGSEESKKSLVILINILVSMNLNVPILVLMNSENDLKINQPFINQNYEEEARKVINYKGNINFIWFSTSHCTDVASFLENNFSLKGKIEKPDVLEILSLFYDFSYFLVSSLLIPFEVVFEEAIDILADINKMNEKQLVILGVDGVGKTTLLYRLILDEIVTTIPTIGFNVETLKYKGYYWNLWDIGGSEKLIHLWIHYMSDKKGIIYIIDSSNIKRREEYVKVFINMVQTIRSIKKENENKKKILILFNIFEEKQDKIDNNEFLDEVKEKSRFTGKIFTLELSILKENLTSLKNLLSNFFI